METENIPQDRNRNIILIVGLLLAAGLVTSLIREFIQTSIIEPLILFYWAFHYLVTQFHQQLIWLALIFIGLHTFIRKMINEIPAEWRSGKPMVDKRSSNIEQWVNKIRMADHGEISKFNLFKDLEKLTIEVLAFEKQVSVKSIRKMIRDNEIELPIQFDREDPFSSNGNQSSNFSARFQKFTNPDKNNVEDKILQIIKFLENFLEAPVNDGRE